MRASRGLSLAWPAGPAIALAIILLTGLGARGGVTLARASVASPTPVAAAGSEDNLAALLGWIPDLPLGQDGAMVTFADIAAQTSALGVDPRSGPASEEALLAAIPIGSLPRTATYWLLPGWREVFGFDLFQVAQAAEYAAPPFVVTVLRGSFDLAELRAAWERAGYQPVDLGGGEAYAVREDYAIDLTAPGGTMALSSLNVVAIASDDTLVFGSTREGVRSALAAGAGRAPSFAARPDIAPLLLGAPSSLVSAVLVPGSAVRAAPDLAAGILEGDALEDVATRVAAEQAEARRLPPVAALLIGQTAGAFPDDAAPATPAPDSAARLVVVLATLTPDAAAEAAAVITERLATLRATGWTEELTNRTWAELFPRRAVSAVAGEPVVLIELDPAPGVPPRLLLDLLFQRALGFLAWD